MLPATVVVQLPQVWSRGTACAALVQLLQEPFWSEQVVHDASRHRKFELSSDMLCM